jgi:tetratricopeptide (TPR) repeat protein
LGAADMALLADMAYAAGHIDVTIAAWERAYSQSVLQEDRLSAAGAAVKIAMHLLLDTALMAPVRGWIKRCQQFLEGYEETPIHAWLAVARNYERLLSGDFSQARVWARLAIEIGTKCAPAPAAIGRVAEARSLIFEGDVAEGLALLNEAALATVSGEVDPLSTGIVFCEVVCALQALAQYDLAEEWTEAMERWRQGRPVGSVHGRCRVHRAESLRLRGFALEAEKEVLLACEELRPYLRRELGWPLTELGRIRLQLGDVAGAEDAFLAAHQAGWDPQPGLALVHLAKGNVRLASGSIGDALTHPLDIPSKERPPNTGLRRAPLLEAQVEIEIASGNFNVAREAAEELAHVAAIFESKALAASATLARGRVLLAEGDARSARVQFEAATRLWNEVGAPFEVAVARMALGKACRADRNETGALLEFRAARSVFEQIGAKLDAVRAARASGDEDQIEAESSSKESQPLDRGAEDLFQREGDYWVVTFAGQTTRLRDQKGLHYLARLLAEAGREVHSMDLVRGNSVASIKDQASQSELRASRGLGAGPMLDAEAKESYRRRLLDIDEDIEDARAMGDSRREAQAESEREFLIRELARAVGLGGRDRQAGSESERARTSVTRAVRQAMTRIHQQNAPLGEHLDHAVRTGTYCSYRPDPRVQGTWRI